MEQSGQKREQHNAPVKSKELIASKVKSTNSALVVSDQTVVIYSVVNKPKPTGVVNAIVKNTDVGGSAIYEDLDARESGSDFTLIDNDMYNGCPGMDTDVKSESGAGKQVTDTDVYSLETNPLNMYANNPPGGLKKVSNGASLQIGDTDVYCLEMNTATKDQDSSGSVGDIQPDLYSLEKNPNAPSTRNKGAAETAGFMLTDNELYY